MDMVPTSVVGERDAIDRLSSTITVLNATRDPARDTGIAFAVDCFRNLAASVARFLLMLLDAQGIEEKPDAFADMPLKDLAALVGRHARAVRFARMIELEHVIESAGAAEQALYRLIRVFPGSEPSELQALGQQWKQLDAVFVGLCVEHVMNSHVGVSAEYGVAR